MYVADRLIEAVCGIDYPRDRLEIQVLDDSTDETRSIAELAVRRLRRGGRRHQVHPSNRPHRLQGRRARGRPGGRPRRVHRDFRRRLHPDRRFPDAPDAALRRPGRRHGAGALGPHQPGLLAADEDPGDPARRPLRARARRAQPRRPLLQFQRDGRRLAAHGDRRRGRLAARHAHRGSRSELPRAAARLAVRVRGRS